MFHPKLNKKLLAALAQAGFEAPTELQAQCISKISSGGDIIGIAADGAGKTSTLAIAAVQKLQYAFEDAPRALILVADKEKAFALKEQFDRLAAETDLRSVCIVEEGKLDVQRRDIHTGTDLVIGTAKRVLEIYFKWSLNLNKIKFFAIDDAERMIKNSWHGEIDRLALSLPKCQRVVFTNNLDEKVEKLISKLMAAPVVIEV